MEKTVLIERPISEVFDYVADSRNSQGYLNQSFHFETVTPPPYGVGTKAVAVGHYMGVNIRLRYTMSAYQPNRLMRLSGPNQNLNGIVVDSEVVWRFQERGPNQTLVGFRLEILPRPQYLRGFSGMIARPIIVAAEACVSGVLDRAMVRLKQNLERSAVGVA